MVLGLTPTLILEVRIEDGVEFGILGSDQSEAQQRHTNRRGRVMATLLASAAALQCGMMRCDAMRCDVLVLLASLLLGRWSLLSLGAKLTSTFTLLGEC